MKVLIIMSFLHHKNKSGIEMMLEHLQWEYKYGNIEDIPNYDAIYFPDQPYDSSIYPKKIFIFGPHFSMYPDDKLLQINNNYKNSVYIQPSKWCIEPWKEATKILPVKALPFPVDTKKFIPGNERNKVFIYHKNNRYKDLQVIKQFLFKQGVEYCIFDYNERYKETDYLSILKQAKYGIIVDLHESQGFAILEALSCNVPLLVWDAKNICCYPTRKIHCTTIPYWDNVCGEVFYTENELNNKYKEFIQKLNYYNPRKYILENLDVDSCAENLKILVESIKTLM